MLLAVLCLLVMVTEGAMADWGGLYLRQDLGASAALAALAYSFFTAGMTAGRLVGDWVNRRIGAVALLRWGALLTGIPLGAMLLIGEPAAALAGLFLVGLGVSNGVPLMFSAAGRQPDTPPGPGIAAVSSMGSLGFLAGPPIIGVRRRRDLAAVGAGDADRGRRRRLRARAPRDRADRARARAAPRPSARAGGGAVSFAAVISDLDGVLVDSAAATSRAWAAWGARHGIDGAAIQAANHGRPARDVVAEHVPARRAGRRGGVPARRRGVRHPRRASPCPGAADVLALPVVAIATSCTLPLAHARLAAAGLAVPDVLVSSDQVAHGQAGARPLPAGGRAARRRSRRPASCSRTRRAASRPAARRG